MVLRSPPWRRSTTWWGRGGRPGSTCSSPTAFRSTPRCGARPCSASVPTPTTSSWEGPGVSCPVPADADRWFTGVTCTDGAGSARGASTEGIEAVGARRPAPGRAALPRPMVGGYGLQVQLGHPSAEVRDPTARGRARRRARRASSTGRAADGRARPRPARSSCHPRRCRLGHGRRLPEPSAPGPAGAPPRGRGVAVARLAGADRPGAARRERARRAAPGVARLLPHPDRGQALRPGRVGRRHGNATFDDQTGLDGAEQVALAVDLTPLAARRRARVSRASSTSLLDRAPRR